MLTVKRLAERWGLHPQTVYKWAKRKKIPGIKLSRSKRGDWRFDLVQIEKWSGSAQPERWIDLS